MKTKDLTIMAILTALAMVLGWVERMIPLELLIPLPGVKLGLANTVTMFSLAFSLTGGVISMLIMAAAKHSRHLSVWGVSVLGAAGHNCGQILIAMILMHSGAVLGYLPYLLLIGTACGCATAAVTAGVLRIVRPS